MKKLSILSLFLVLSSISCTNMKNEALFEVNGKIDGMPSGTVLLQYGGKCDTVQASYGEFRFTGTTNEPQPGKIIIPGLDNHLEFYLENSTITIEGHLDSLEEAVVLGSKTEDEDVDYKRLLETFDKQFAAVEKEYEHAEEDRKAELLKLYDETDWALVEAQRQFVRDHPTSYLCIKILKDIDWSFSTATEYNEYISLLDKSLNPYPGLIAMKEEAARMELVEVGKTAPDFEINDAEDHKVSLSSIYSGSKYTLLDFWASTCGPCRIENKEILLAYQKYHPKGFNVIGVSTDTRKESWLKAIEMDSLTWTNTCNFKDWNENELVKTFALRQVSANFLLDNSGTIVASDIRGEKLHSTLEELFGRDEI